METIKDNIDRALNCDLTVSTIIEDNIILEANNTTNNISTNYSNIVKLSSEPENQNLLREKSEKISDTLKNVQLPLRKKSPENEPFEKLIGLNYMTYFLAVSSIAIFCIGLFN